MQGPLATAPVRPADRSLIFCLCSVCCSIAAEAQARLSLLAQKWTFTKRLCSNIVERAACPFLLSAPEQKSSAPCHPDPEESFGQVVVGAGGSAAGLTLAPAESAESGGGGGGGGLSEGLLAGDRLWLGARSGSQEREATPSCR